MYTSPGTICSLQILHSKSKSASPASFSPFPGGFAARARLEAPPLAAGPFPRIDTDCVGMGREFAKQ
eukprot:CAMPEP_0115510902 /NCGR_PEP_ID=MMETSP0271-20121206/73675_1 /TAXON_ID=71861 /ORGANISM="Scrippsiella trochoidea, Strain CCMP3099" /LENGTH=66 /DNA_ID=CAMNT_0002940927 /DNA_START=828 /DNA_END=1025 /DNA_ORIENTATION=-